MMANTVVRYYQRPGLSDAKVNDTLAKLKTTIAKNVTSIQTEFCYYVGINGFLNESDQRKVEWILSPTFDSTLAKSTSLAVAVDDKSSAKKCLLFIEIGPRLSFSTAFSTNAVSICAAVGLAAKINRIERSIRYQISFEGEISGEVESLIVNQLHDRMTEQRYTKPIDSFALPVNTETWTEIDIINRGEEALRQISDELGLAFDEWDIQYYTNLFRDTLKRNPTSVECFDLAQSNSEHSRHWFFKGNLVIDGKQIDRSLIDMVADTQNHTNDNNVIKFNDNSSAIKGFSDLKILLPVNSTEASLVKVEPNKTRHIIFTAETHNFPTGVAPFPGATTGTGGRIRDVQAAGRGAHVVAGTAGYSFGNLNIPGYDMEWEDKNEVYPTNFASPLQVCVEASNGASDYGNKFGEPVLTGFARSFGQRLPNNERYEWIKPIMFSGGIGTIDEGFVGKMPPEIGMSVAKIGGPIYRIGVGGGAASSTKIQGNEENQELDYGAVQRGDPEMEQKLNRFLRACIEYSDKNPIQAIHDQGAGGNGNVLKEIADPLGAKIYTDRFSLGDPTVNTLELWGAEYQESNAILIRPEDHSLLQKISEREKCKIDFVGEVTGDKHITLVSPNDKNGVHAVNLELKHVLGSMPNKTFQFKTTTPLLRPLQLPTNLKLIDALNRVLRLPSVASKRYLTNKVDRSVTGLVAQQQCIGPLHTPLADYAVIAMNYFNFEGSATSIGEQPIKGLISAEANGRLTVAEAITNLMFCVISDLRDVKCSGNWMWAAKLDGEGAKLVKTCESMCQVMNQLGIGIDGGKDSLSMAANVKVRNNSEVVKSPGTLVVSCYAPVPDIRVKVTPELRVDGTQLLYINLSGHNKHRIGASALAQVFGQIGDESPDLNNPQLLKDCFNLVQELIKGGICTAGHDISDGGLITCVLEMAFASNCGIEVNIECTNNADIEVLFAEECGVVIEIIDDYLPKVLQDFKRIGLEPQVIGKGLDNQDLVIININNKPTLRAKMTELRDKWEETSFELEMFQTNKACVQQERNGLKHRKHPKWTLTYNPDNININIDNHFKSAPRVAVIREEGINGDREMIASLYMVGFEVADVTITDILNKKLLTLEAFRGLIFPGGFSYADVLGSARGWAATMKFNDIIAQQLERFRSRNDTFSLGVCNGCQLMALLGWVGSETEGKPETVVTHNDSERFESRFVSVKIEETTNAIMFKEMQSSAMGVWVSHGEGKFAYVNDSILKKIEQNNCIALRYVDDLNNCTQEYPMNPNGSALGIAGIASKDGRHLALMPHPERATFIWQWPYIPKKWKHLKVSPWAKMFRNAYDWCITA
ncbi:phosphoribosylformylglycinamidine synthase-like [Oppia nitens]|uniref:phosphoribosylformylglycinamidine synthase-like n=1 Tax=Oppia nitens TaxID=1686743 RepID=UPI0023DB4CAE|nr:phosphoribosylformylglycinamidine synthase-like [Oppia nitens]